MNLRTIAVTLGALPIAAAGQDFVYVEQSRTMDGFAGGAGAYDAAPDFGPAALSVSDDGNFPGGVASIQGTQNSELRPDGIFISGSMSASADGIYGFCNTSAVVTIAVAEPMVISIVGMATIESNGSGAGATSTIGLWNVGVNPHEEIESWVLQSAPGQQTQIVDEDVLLPPGHYRFGVGQHVANYITPGTAASSFTVEVVRSGDPCRADWNGDGLVNTSDFIAYLTDYSYVRIGAPFVHNDPDLAAPFGVMNTSDFLEYLNAYTNGC